MLCWLSGFFFNWIDLRGRQLPVYLSVVGDHPLKRVHTKINPMPVSFSSCSCWNIFFFPRTAWWKLFRFWPEEKFILLSYLFLLNSTQTSHKWGGPSSPRVPVFALYAQLYVEKIAPPERGPHHRQVGFNDLFQQWGTDVCEALTIASQFRLRARIVGRLC